MKYLFLIALLFIAQSAFATSEDLYTNFKGAWFGPEVQEGDFTVQKIKNFSALQQMVQELKKFEIPSMKNRTGGPCEGTEPLDDHPFLVSTKSLGNSKYDEQVYKFIQVTGYPKEFNDECGEPGMQVDRLNFIALYIPQAKSWYAIKTKGSFDLETILDSSSGNSEIYFSVVVAYSSEGSGNSKDLNALRFSFDRDEANGPLKLSLKSFSLTDDN